MREMIIANLSSKIPTALAEELLTAYEQLVAKHRSGDLEAALTKGGRFVEHVFRTIEFLRTGTEPNEIKQVARTMQLIENDTTLSDSLRFLIPRAAYGMIYNIRSKRNAVHVKEIDPTQIDVSLTVAAAGWIMGELLRLYHKSDEGAVAEAMLSMTRGSIPLIEAINGEIFVGISVPAKNEILLLLAHAKPDGMNRTALGTAAKCSPSSVTTALKDLTNRRLVHQSADGKYFITGHGEHLLSQWVLTGK